jgi:hypothetical protein
MGGMLSRPDLPLRHRLAKERLILLVVEATLKRRHALALLAALVRPTGLAAWAQLPKLEDLAEGPLLLEMPAMEPRALNPTSRREAGGRRILTFSPVDPVSIRQVVSRVGERLLKRSFEIYAERDTILNLSIAYDFPQAGSFYSWRRNETSTVDLVQDTGELDRTQADSQLFPFAGAVVDGVLTGALGDCPGFWENRSQQRIVTDRRLVCLRTGDGSNSRSITRIWGDTSGRYRGEVDGWQHLRSGETRTFDTWIFQQPVRDLYDVRLAAHRAMAAAKGWNDSALTAILRNNAYLQVRRNLLRDESRYILISGVNYGWKEWASDVFLAGLGLENQEVLAEAVRGLFWERLNYEDNAQYYLIGSALMARSGYRPNQALCNRCFEFIRDHEKDGAYIPPRGQDPANGLGWKSYMDLFYYADGDSPLSNQGFHCGALLAAAALGLGATEGDFTDACRAFARAFNGQGGYFPTSALRPEVFGGDALYGEAITFAAFGRKSLPDDLVLRHCQHARDIQTRFGIRVVSKANGDLLEADQYGPGNPHGLPPEKAGAYVQGGSWFFCDAGTWLSGLAHGLKPELVDSLLISRIRAELAFSPSFCESIHTRTGQPHGNVLYGANAVYLWLRSTIRQRLGHKAPDPVDAAIGRYLLERRG